MERGSSRALKRPKEQSAQQHLQTIVRLHAKEKGSRASIDLFALVGLTYYYASTASRLTG